MNLSVFWWGTYTSRLNLDRDVTVTFCFLIKCLEILSSPSLSYLEHWSYIKYIRLGHRKSLPTRNAVKWDILFFFFICYYLLPYPFHGVVASVYPFFKTYWSPMQKNSRPLTTLEEARVYRGQGNLQQNTPALLWKQLILFLKVMMRMSDYQGGRWLILPR